MAKSFAQQVDEWTRKTKARVSAVHKKSVELLADEMSTSVREGGRVPYKDGNLARSLLASTTGMPKTAEGPFSGASVGIVTATLRVDQPVWLGYQAVYARRQNYGFVGADVLGRVYNQQGSYFVEYAIDMWPTIVKRAAEKTRQGVESRGT